MFALYPMALKVAFSVIEAKRMYKMASYAAPVFDIDNHLDLVNQIRGEVSKEPLSLIVCMTDAAQAQSEYQASEETMTHDSPKGGLSDRMVAYGMVNGTGWAENVAAGYQSDTEVVNGWKNSPGHYANMIGNYTYIGIGMKVSDKGTPYWTQQFIRAGACEAIGSASSTMIPVTLIALVSLVLMVFLVIKKIKRFVSCFLFRPYHGD
ncbi:hypothetical protein DFA_08594 [Cavenderia fasciculata]|uniref:SCP domain-containing protein n=1 Tax=Cavenderia fasciculata TaxID=261658 RepID=F4Q388_CACFS|nr:uncharacterized protein DFA_08594 [Cavenderia fasciculata]EGG17598.1 hypothetical protein DFA_08594 [Cavenderia fasciculata]|eukprot:XP_004356082.1 hypothetical protein DFA_08594 [Cavenderia fasciculata]